MGFSANKVTDFRALTLRLDRVGAETGFLMWCRVQGARCGVWGAETGCPPPNPVAARCADGRIRQGKASAIHPTTLNPYPNPYAGVPHSVETAPPLGPS